MDIPFIKMQGAGNDYIYLDLLERELEVDYSLLAKKISDRHFGVGGDGVVLILKGKNSPFMMRMFNADGSEAEMCGNAIRCVGKYIHDRGLLSGDRFNIQTIAGIKDLKIIEKDPSGKAIKLQVDMGEPILNGPDIPVNINKNPVLDIEIMGYRGAAVSMGNPHLVIFSSWIDDRMVLEHGPELEKNPIFPKKTNVEFVKVLDRKNVEVRVWERGTGETLACGTGACAVCVAGVLSEKTEPEVNVKLSGGTLQVKWDRKNNHVYMSGPAEEVFKGIYFYHPHEA